MSLDNNPNYLKDRSEEMPAKDLLSIIYDSEKFEKYLNVPLDEKESLLESIGIESNISYQIDVLDNKVIDEKKLILALVNKCNITVHSFFTLSEEAKSEMRVEKLLIHHITARDTSNRAEFAREVLKEFPEYVYMGSAFRAVHVTSEPFELKETSPGASFALSFEGMKFFLDNSNQHEGYYILKADIVGLNLVRLIKEKFPSIMDFHPDYNDLTKEDEIVSTEIISVHSVEKITF